MDYIEYNKKKYPVKEITIEMWSELMKFKDLLEEEEMYYRMISSMIGLSRDEINKLPASEILKVGEELNEILNKDSRQLHPKLEHNGKTYLLTDMNDLSFGQFVDIDTFLTKDESYRIANLHELASYLYVEEGKKYGEVNFKKQTEDFKKLPIKYIEGAIFFLLTFGKALQLLSQISSKKKLLWSMMKFRITLTLIGVGTKRLIFSHKTKFGKLMGLLLSPFYLVLTICRTIWTLIKKKSRG